MASYGGVDLGLVFFMNTAPNPKARQINTYAGADGLEVLDHGSRGGRTVMAGALIAPGAASLSAAEQALRSFQQDGSPYTLVDTAGRSWPGVILEEVSPEGRAYRAIGAFGLTYYGRRYRAQFLHVR